MPDLGEILERESSSVDLGPDAFEGLLRRRDVKQRRRSIGAVAIAVVIAALAIGTLIRAFDRSVRPVPSDRITERSVGNLGVAWSAGLPGSSERDGLPTRPVTDGKSVFVGSGATLYAFPTRCANDGGSCAPSWMANLGGHADELAVGDGQVVALVGDRLLSFAASCGIERAVCEPTWTATLLRDPNRGTGLDLQADSGVVVATTAWNGTGRTAAFSLTCGTGGARCRPLFSLAPADNPIPSPGDDQAAVAFDGTWFIAPGADATVQAFPVTCPPRTPGCVPTWTWTAPDGASTSLLGVDHGVVFVTLASDPPGPGNLYRTVAFPTSCASPCGPVWSTDGAGFLADGYLYVEEKGFNHGGASRWGPTTVFLTSCIGDGATCAPAWTATADKGARGIGFADGSKGALVLGLHDATVRVYPASCVGATTPCLPSVLDTGFPSGYAPFVRLVGDVAFASSYYYEPGGSVVAYPADCGSDGPCPILWSHRFARGEHVAGPLLVTPDDTSIFVVTADRAGARLYALAPVGKKG